MHSFKTFMLAIALVLFLATASTAAQGQKGMGRKQGPAHAPAQSYGYGYSQLTEEQQQALQDIYAQYSGDLYSLGAKLMAKKAELNAELAASEVDENKIKDLVQEVNELRSQMFSQRTQMNLEMRKQGLYQFGRSMMYPGGFGHGMGPGMMHGGQGMMQHRPRGTW